jgi:hypothetical protein
MKSNALNLSRFWAALCVLLVGSAFALRLVHGDLNVWLGLWSRVLDPAGLVSMAGTLGLLSAGMLISRSAAGLLAAFLPACGAGLVNVGFLLGMAAVFFPVNTLLWSFLGLWIGRLGHPVWTLLPVAELTGDLTAAEVVARFVWTWAPAFGLVCVPLTGLWLARLLGGPSLVVMPAEDGGSGTRNLATPHLTPAKRDAGRQPTPSSIQWREGILLSHPAREQQGGPRTVVNTGNHQRPWGAGILALLLLVCIEDTLKIHGSAAAFAQSLRANDFTSAAGDMLMLTCIASLWTLVVGGPGPWAVRSVRHGFALVFKFAAWSVLVLTLVADFIGLQFPLLAEIHPDTAFASPGSVLMAGLPTMLCALSLWLAGHIIRPQNEP